jgi:hypothetical protein
MRKMNDSLKTIGFVAVAAVVSLIVWVTRPRLPELSAESDLPKVLFPEFDDPLDAASLEIVEFDESTATLKPFKVAQVDQEWSIPSHNNYPADAEDRLPEVAAGLVGLEPLDMATDRPGDHKLFGVVEPDPDKLKPGDTGVGTRVEMRDENDEVLVSLVIGKKVPDQEELTYVRPTGRDQVYTVKLKADKISTKFEDWIEEDLLKLNTWDVKQVRVRDYSADLRAQLTATGIGLGLDQVQRSLMTLEYDDQDSKWKLVEDKAFDEQERAWRDVPMADDEELNTSKLNDMKWALDDLKIVDVAPKPEGLSETLRATGKVKPDSEAFNSLADRGFYLVSSNDHLELISSEGEITVLMKDGVQYVLRFGQVAGAGEEASDASETEGEQDEAADEDEPKSDGGVNRYLFVMAEFNPEAMPKPELEPLPEEGKASEGEAPKSEASEAQAPPGGASEGDAAEGDASAGDTSKSDGGNGGSDGGNGGGEPEGEAPPAKDAGDGEGEPKQPQAPKPDTEKAKAPAPEAEKSKMEPSAGAEPSEGEEPASSEKPSPESKKPGDAETGEGEEKAKEEQPDEGDLAKERERIEKENQRKQDEYEDKVNKGKERVQDLNQRFADWYYVISNDVYQKIHLSREDVIKKKEKEEDEGEEQGEAEEDQEKAEPAEAAQRKDAGEAKKEGNAVSDFEQIKQEGLEKAKE